MLSDGSSYSFAHTICVRVGVFAATAISVIICIISASMIYEKDDTESDVDEYDECRSLISVDKDPTNYPSVIK